MTSFSLPLLPAACLHSAWHLALSNKLQCHQASHSRTDLATWLKQESHHSDIMSKMSDEDDSSEDTSKDPSQSEVTSNTSEMSMTAMDGLILNNFNTVDVMPVTLLADLHMGIKSTQVTEHGTAELNLLLLEVGKGYQVRTFGCLHCSLIDVAQHVCSDFKFTSILIFKGYLQRDFSLWTDVALLATFEPSEIPDVQMSVENLPCIRLIDVSHNLFRNLIAPVFEETAAKVHILWYTTKDFVMHLPMRSIDVVDDNNENVSDVIDVLDLPDLGVVPKPIFQVFTTFDRNHAECTLIALDVPVFSYFEQCLHFHATAFKLPGTSLTSNSTKQSRSEPAQQAIDYADDPDEPPY